MKIKNFFVVVIVSVLSSVVTYYLLSNKIETNEDHISFSNQNLLKPKTVAISNAANTNFIDAAAISTPAVVHVKTSYEINTTNSQQFYGDDVFEWFFGYKNPQNKRQTRKQQVASGSGVIISEDGYIVTNNHVIEKANTIEVTLSNNKKYNAKLVGVDKDTDLAVLKIEEINLPNLLYANSDEVRVGEWVLAVGNPFNLSSTVTAGIVSAKGRNINILKNHNKNHTGNTAIESFIQTDAAVNPGNSGGALINTRGELIGINTAIATPTGTFAGYSFAVPSNLVSKVVDDIIDFGEAQRPFLGVNIVNITNEMAFKLKLVNMEGVFIANVQENGAAWEAGLEVNDVILSIDSEKIKTVAELQEKIAEYRPNDVIEVLFVRENEKNSINVKLQ